MVPFTTQCTVFTDASKDGWGEGGGAHMDEWTASRIWTPAWRSLPINWLELEVVRRALLAFKPKVTNRQVLVMTTERASKSWWRGGMRFKRLLVLARTILLWYQSLNMWFQYRHIADSFNVKANWLSHH